MSEFKRDYKRVPTFRRNALQRKVPLSYRKPKGLFNKRKDGSKSKGKLVKIGYGQNRKYRYLVPSFELINNKPANYEKAKLKVLKIVQNLTQLNSLEASKQDECIILSGNLGKKKRNIMISYCNTHKIRIFPFQLYKIRNES